MLFRCQRGGTSHSGGCLSAGRHDTALCILLGFDGLVRTAEVLGFRACHANWNHNLSRGCWHFRRRRQACGEEGRIPSSFQIRRCYASCMEFGSSELRMNLSWRCQNTSFACSGSGCVRCCSWRTCIFVLTRCEGEGRRKCGPPQLTSRAS